MRSVSRKEIIFFETTLIMVLAGVHSMSETCQEIFFLGSTEDCPDVYDLEDFNDLCCEDSRPHFHCQEQTVDGTPHVVAACLNKIRCDAGTFARLSVGQNSGSQSSPAFVICLPCPDGMYEPEAKDSNLFLKPGCSRQIHTCSKNKKQVMAGNASHDTLCICDWNKGWKPNPPSAECILGFHDHQACGCDKSTCGAGRQLNNEYKCEISVTSVSVTSVTSTKFQRNPKVSFQTGGTNPLKFVSKWTSLFLAFLVSRFNV